MESVVFFQEIFFPLSFSAERDLMFYEELRVRDWRDKLYLEKWRIKEDLSTGNRIETYIEGRQIANGD